jgi:uncharacterized protein YdaU (DUF1376 family)
MGNKKNLPNIPLYIGDWEKDCNVLSLEAEAAWLRIIFKMFTNGKQSSYKIPTKGLQNLWKVSEEKASEIIQELTDFNICIINIDGRFIEFTCRRYIRENQVSEIRKKAVSSRKDRTKTKETSYKKSTKHIQNTEIEIEIENENNIDKREGVGEKEDEKPKRFNFRKAMIAYGFRDDLVDEWMRVRKAKKAVNSEKSFDNFISEVEKSGEDKNTLLELIAVKKQWRGFQEKWLAELVKNDNNFHNGQQKQQSATSDEELAANIRAGIERGIKENAK